MDGRLVCLSTRPHRGELLDRVVVRLAADSRRLGVLLASEESIDLEARPEEWAARLGITFQAADNARLDLLDRG